MSICGNVAGGFGFPKTFILQDENGNDIGTGVVVGQEMVFNAGVNDVREGKVFANSEGVMTGTKDIPSYRTTNGYVMILPDMSYSIPLNHYNQYDYTQFQCVIAKFNTSFTDSVATDKVSLEGNVYEVNSTVLVSQVTKNADTSSIDLNIINNTENVYVIHYFTFKEEY